MGSEKPAKTVTTRVIYVTEIMYLNAQILGIDEPQHPKSIGEGPHFGGIRQAPQLKFDLCYVRFLYIFFNIDPFLMIFAPLES